MESQVVATAGAGHMLIVNGNLEELIVNGKGELYITSGAHTLSSVYHEIAPEPQSTLRLIFSQLTANHILQISMNFSHSAFVTETGQMTKSFPSLKHHFEMNVKP
jgi:hypothetical protein